MSKQAPPAPTASAVDLCPTLIQIGRTPRHWKFTQHHRTTRQLPLCGDSSLNIFYFQSCTLQHINDTITQKIGSKRKLIAYITPLLTLDVCTDELSEILGLSKVRCKTELDMAVNVRSDGKDVPFSSELDKNKTKTKKKTRIQFKVGIMIRISNVSRKQLSLFFIVY